MRKNEEGPGLGVDQAYQRFEGSFFDFQHHQRRRDVLTPQILDYKRKNERASDRKIRRPLQLQTVTQDDSPTTYGRRRSGYIPSVARRRFLFYHPGLPFS